VRRSLEALSTQRFPYSEWLYTVLCFVEAEDAVLVFEQLLLRFLAVRDSPLHHYAAPQKKACKHRWAACVVSSGTKR
jgi:hypothetical protein